jgi:cytochrome P450
VSAQVRVNASARNGTNCSFVWGTPMVIVSSPRLVRHIFKDAKERFPKDPWSYSFFKPILGEGLVTAEGERWRKQNEVLKPKFQHAALRQYMRAFTGAASRLCDKWSKLSDGSTVELDSTFRQVTLEVISEVTLGLTPKDTTRFPELFAEVIDELNQRMFQPWRPFLPLEREHQRRLAELEGIVRGLIAARRAEYKEAGGVPEHRRVAEEGSEAGSGDFLDIMLQSDAEWTDTQLADQLKTMLLAGHETSSMMLTWCVFLLVKHPEAMAKAVKEVDEAWAASGKGAADLTWEGIERMSLERPDNETFLHWSLHEAMRLYTPVPVLAKVTQFDDEELGGVKLPRGTQIQVSCSALHTDPKLWGSDAGEFRPERHRKGELARTLGKDANYTFIPFSVGSRECIGRRLALIEAKTIMAYVLKNFTLDLAPKQSRDPATDCYIIPVRPRDGMYMTIRARK